MSKKQMIKILETAETGNEMLKILEKLASLTEQ